MSVPVHPWESDEPWARPPQAEDDGSGDEQPFDYDAVTLPEACAEFYDHLVHMKHAGLISAKSCCITAWWAWKAGAGGVEKLAFAPGKNSGAYSKHFDAVVFESARDENDFYEVLVPGECRGDASGMLRNVPVIPPHEALWEEVSSTPHLLQRVVEARDNKLLPPAYYDHPVVESAPAEAIVVPTAIYMDGISFVRHDNIEGVWFYNLITCTRTLVCVLRRSELCACGCRGWDSFYQILLMLAWSYRALATGEFPRERHDKAPWAMDVGRSSLGGAPMNFRACLLFVKGDLAEYGKFWGLPSTASHMHPCPFCAATSADWSSLLPFSCLGNTRSMSWDLYNEACERCEVLVEVTELNFARLRASLRKDRRLTGNRGWALTRSFPDLELEAGDRLEPCPEMPLVESFFTRERPFYALFWRRGRETAARHRNPIFARDLGTAPATTIAIDFLHVVALGVCKFWSSRAIHALMDANVWHVRGTKDVVQGRSVATIKSLLFAWYRGEALEGRGDDHTRVQDLTPGMVGTTYRDPLGLHGAEAVAFTKFLVKLVQEKAGLMDREIAAPLCEAGVALETILEQNSAMKPDPHVDLWRAETFLQAAKKTCGIVEPTGHGVQA